MEDDVLVEEQPVEAEQPVPDWLADIFDRYGYVMAPEDMEAIANASMVRGIELEDRDYQLKLGDQYLQQLQHDYLTQDLGLKGRQLDQAQKELEFQSGPWWDWYSTEKFEQDKVVAENQMQMSNNQLEGSLLDLRRGAMSMKNAQSQANTQALNALSNSASNPYNREGSGARISGY